MSKTAIGLFENPARANEAVSALTASGFPRKEIRVLGEPRDLPVDGVLGTPRTDFEVSLDRELRTFGATADEANAYMEGVRRGGTLVFATGNNEDVDQAVDIMNSRGARKIEEFLGLVPAVATQVAGVTMPGEGESPQSGRVRQEGGGARLFVW
jgi:hypothetical protein